MRQQEEHVATKGQDETPEEKPSETEMGIYPAESSR